MVFQSNVGLDKVFTAMPNEGPHWTKILPIAVDLECTWQYPLSEFRPKQTKAACVNRVDLSLWASMAVSMITSFT